MYLKTGHFRIMVIPIVIDNELIGNKETLQMETQCQSYGSIVWDDVPYVDADGKEIDYERKMR